MDELLKLKHRLHDLDTINESKTLSELEIVERSLGIQRITELEKLAILDLKQKARLRWTVDGDKNTHFFHGYINNKKSKNFIHELIISGSWNTNVTTIKGEVFSFYQNKFQECWPSRQKLTNSDFNRLDLATSSSIEDPFMPEEIKEVIWACGGDKAPDPDGFTFDFIKNSWDLLKGDITEFVRYFEKYGNLEQGCNSSFIMLFDDKAIRSGRGKDAWELTCQPPSCVNTAPPSGGCLIPWS
ncbi:uncharacterized protein LOC111915298 [Lactuca sativa]|uniref:uncharacterized protein LOC111915298 n=1 Tax=Lactuca sativa TaxID=4236 RepID=UPI000CD8DCB7|nr:uncharacterized protein LOC111915298 [Lactuca sativa]